MISAIGNNVPEAYANLSNGKTGIGKVNYLTTRYKDEYVLGEVKLSNEQIMDLISNHSPALNRTSLLGIAAAREAVLHSGIDLKDGLRTGLISSTTVAGMCKTELFYGEMV